jgi:hypothetical protein
MNYNSAMRESDKDTKAGTGVCCFNTAIMRHHANIL